MAIGFTWNGAPGIGQFTSTAGQAETINYNPAFVAGGGSLTNDPSGSPSSGANPAVSPWQSASTSTGFPAGAGLATLNTAYPAAAGGAAPGSPLSGSTMLFLLLAVGLVLVLSDGGGKRR